MERLEFRYRLDDEETIRSVEKEDVGVDIECILSNLTAFLLGIGYSESTIAKYINVEG